MAHQHIVLPNSPVLLIHKEWQCSSWKAAATTTITATQGEESVAVNDTNFNLVIMKPSSTCNTKPQTVAESKTAVTPQQSRPKCTKSFQFVNATGPSRHRDEDVRRLVRSHVRKGIGRRSRRSAAPGERESSKAGGSDSSAQCGEPHFVVEESEQNGEDSSGITLRMPSACPGSATALYGANFPVVINPCYHFLISYFLFTMAEAMYPLKSLLLFNPVKTVWFHRAITNEVILHSVLFASAMRLSSTTSDPSVRNVVTALMNILVRYINRRLRSLDVLSDDTIGAVQCLALSENRHGNYPRWKVHMEGLKEMVRIRGGLSLIEKYLRLEICRTDIDGAVDNVTTPNLPRFERSLLPTYALVPAGKMALPSGEVLDILRLSGLSSRLINTFCEIFRLSHAINYLTTHRDLLIDPMCFEEDMLLIQYDLLDIPDVDKNDVVDACLLGALLYMKTITRPMWTVLRTSEMLIERLQSYLETINHDSMAPALFVWLLSMGGVTCEFGTPERTWFVGKLATLTTSSSDELPGWTSVRQTLKRVAWIDSLHDELGQALWHETEMSRPEG